MKFTLNQKQYDTSTMSRSGKETMKGMLAYKVLTLETVLVEAFRIQDGEKFKKAEELKTRLLRILRELEK